MNRESILEIARSEDTGICVIFKKYKDYCKVYSGVRTMEYDKNVTE